MALLISHYCINQLLNVSSVPISVLLNLRILNVIHIIDHGEVLFFK